MPSPQLDRVHIIALYRTIIKQSQQKILEHILIIKEQSCILDGLTCYEYPTFEVLDQLLNSDLLQLKQYETTNSYE
jgi:hypothetical protein